MKALETDRLILRGFCKADLEDFYAYTKQPKVGPMAGWSPHETKDESKRVLKMFIKEKECWAVVEKKSGKLIGNFGLHKDTRRNNPQSRRISYAYAEEFWGKGYATEAMKRVLKFAFEENSDIAIIEIYHYPFNKASKRVIEKCGFTYEGIRREAVLRFDGELLDDVCYSMTKREYNEQYQIKEGTIREKVEIK